MTLGGISPTTYTLALLQTLAGAGFQLCAQHLDISSVCVCVCEMALAATQSIRMSFTHSLQELSDTDFFG